MTLLFTIALHNVAIAVFLALLVWSVTRVWKNPPVAHLLWLLVLVKLVTPPLVNFELWKWESATTEAELTADASVGMQPPHLDDSQSPTRTSVQTSENVVESNRSGVARSTVGSRDDVIPYSPRFTAAAVWSVIRRILIGIWLCGIAVVALLTSRRIVHFNRLLAGTRPASERLQSVAKDLVIKMGLRRVPDLRVVDCSVPPLVWCVGWRAKIVLPQRLLGTLNEHQTAMVIAHELAHLRRHDHLVRIVELVVSVVYWWNPLVWCVRRELHAVEEQCCDAWVSWVYPDRSRDYAESLLTAVELLTALAKAPALASPFLNAQTLKERIVLVLKGCSQRTTSRFAAVWLTLLAAVVIPAGVLTVGAEAPALTGDGPAATGSPKRESTKLAAQVIGSNEQDQKSSNRAAKAEALLVVTAVNDKPVPDEARLFQGTWNFGLFDSILWKTPLEEIKKTWTWKIEGQQITWTRAGHQPVKLSFTIDPSHTPNQIDFTFLDGPDKGQKCQGIYEFERGHIWLCMTEPGANVDRPKRMEMSSSSHTSLIIMEDRNQDRSVGAAKQVADAPPAATQVEDRRAEIDAAIVRLRDLGAFVREFHPRGDPQYWVQIIPTGLGATTRQSAENFDDAAMNDVEIIARAVALHLHLRHTSVTSAGLARLGSAGRIEMLELTGPNVTYGTLKVLPTLPLRGHLGIHSDQLTNAMIKPASECQELTGISLGGSQLGNACLEYLTRLPKLQSVSLGKQFTREAFAVLGRLENLTSLDVSELNPELSDLKQVPKLRRLSLSGKAYNDEAALTIADTFKSLEEAYLRHTSMTNAGVRHLSRLESLKILTLDNSLVTDGMADSIRKMKQLKWLSVENCAIGDDTLAAVSECPELWYLYLAGTPVTDKGIAKLVKCKKPLSLYLAHCKSVTDAGVEFLAQMPDSEGLHLELTGSGITEDGVKRLKTALPHAQISWVKRVPN